VRPRCVRQDHRFARGWLRSWHFDARLRDKRQSQNRGVPLNDGEGIERLPVLIGRGNLGGFFGRVVIGLA
jgi:hypothetical protein